MMNFGPVDVKSLMPHKKFGQKGPGGCIYSGPLARCSMLVRAFIVLLFAGTALAGELLTIEGLPEHSGMCDASAGVAIDENLFLAVNDEDNTLRVYRNDAGGPPLSQVNLNTFLEVQGNSLEADLEGAAQIGSRVFIVGSHGLNRQGKERFNRQRFFAVTIVTNQTGIEIHPEGVPCKTLLDQLLRDPRVAPFHLAAAATKAPKEPNALNIEGLASTPDGHLLLGFRNPVPGGKALVIPLLNPEEVLQGALVRFGDPIRLDLGGLGIRDMARWRNKYFIIAGPYHGGGPFHFYLWKGTEQKPKRLKSERIGDCHPEAVIIYPNRGLHQVQILCDDGNRMVNGRPCKQLGGQGKFRSMWLDFEAKK
jgi:hypothetical protein